MRYALFGKPNEQGIGHASQKNRAGNRLDFGQDFGLAILLVHFVQLNIVPS